MFAGGGVYDGEHWAGELVEAVPASTAWAQIQASRAPGGSAHGMHHIVYTQPDAHNDGANYIFADGHAKWVKLDATLDPDHFMWGKMAYPCGPGYPVLRPGTTTPVG